MLVASVNMVLPLFNRQAASMSIHQLNLMNFVSPQHNRKCESELSVSLTVFRCSGSSQPHVSQSYHTQSYPRPGNLVDEHIIVFVLKCLYRRINKRSCRKPDWQTVVVQA